MYKKIADNSDIVICDGAHVVGDVKLGKGVSVWYNAVIRSDEGEIIVGENTNIQDNAVLHAKTTVGKGCTIGHSAIVHGCTVGNNVLIGMGSIVLNGAVIGDNCIVGAGAVVTGKTNAPAGSMLLGSPARVVRSLTDEEIDGIRESAEEYLRLAENYRKSNEV